MSPKDWLSIWTNLPRSLQRDLVNAVPLLIVGFCVVVMVLSIGLISSITRVIHYLRQHDSPYPGMSDAHFTYCLETSRDTLAARQALERLGPTPPPAGVATDAAFQQVDRLAIQYRQYCDERIWKAAFAAGQRESGIPPATTPEGWLAADRY